MNPIVQILGGALTGWLTAKSVESEGRTGGGKHSHLSDVFFGIVGALVGDYLFFWVVIGKGTAFSDFATAILGSITVVGAARLVARVLSRLGS